MLELDFDDIVNDLARKGGSTVKRAFSECWQVDEDLYDILVEKTEG